jgi:hypothetical protein
MVERNPQPNVIFLFIISYEHDIILKSSLDEGCILVFNVKIVGVILCHRQVEGSLGDRVQLHQIFLQLFLVHHFLGRSSKKVYVPTQYCFDEF